MFTGNNNPVENFYSSEDIPEEEKSKVLGDVAQDIVERGLTAPAIFFLEVTKPLSFIGSQVLIMANPVVQAIFHSKKYWEISLLLEKRENVEYLIQEIERRNNESKKRPKKNNSN